MNEFEKRHANEEGVPIDLVQQEKFETLNRDMSEISVILASKYKPVLRNMMSIKEEENLNNLYSTIKATTGDDLEMAVKYKRCFNAFVNSPEVSFVAKNKEYLKNIAEMDYFILEYFAMLTNKRQKHDNLLQLICCGKNSSGKSTLFENPLQEVCHNFATEKGVGRFVTSAKSTLLLHDVDLSILYTGSDKDKLKALSRTEPITAKIQGSTVSVPPIFLFVTSNQHLLTHTFLSDTTLRLGKRWHCQSDVTVKANDEDKLAIQNRYVECFVRNRPVMPPDSLPTHGNFVRNHAIVGLFPFTLSILNKYERSDFASPYLFLYGLSGLAKNLALMRSDFQAPIKTQITSLIDKFQLDHNESLQIEDQYTSVSL